MPDRSTHSPKQDAATSAKSLDTELTDLPQSAPTHPFTTNVVAMQRYIGNRGVQRLINDGTIQPQQGNRLAMLQHIQREDGDGTSAPTPDPRLEAILKTSYKGSNPRFDLDYKPTGGKPATDRPIAGQVAVTLKLHINFRDFTKEIRKEEPYNTMKFTKEQREDFTWKPDEEAKFKQDIVPAIQDGWKEKHRLDCKDPGLEELSATVNVVVSLVGDAKDAHTKITAQKIPKGAPRYRSFVQGDEATLDRLDPTEEETHDVDDKVWNIEPFDNDSADVTPVQGKLDAFIREFEAIDPKGSPEKDQEFSDKYTIRFVGRASSTGSKKYNEKLAQKRADAVDEYIFANTSRSQYSTRSASDGETGTTEDESFRRVDIYLTRNDAVKQNVAAHEAGHMFGLGDEYEDAEDDDNPTGRGRFTGDAPDHAGDVAKALGPDAPPDMEVRNSESMMAVGNQVGPEHYAPFINQLESVTGLDWTIKP